MKKRVLIIIFILLSVLQFPNYSQGRDSKINAIPASRPSGSGTKGHTAVSVPGLPVSHMLTTTAETIKTSTTKTSTTSKPTTGKLTSTKVQRTTKTQKSVTPITTVRPQPTARITTTKSSKPNGTTVMPTKLSTSLKSSIKPTSQNRSSIPTNTTSVNTTKPISQSTSAHVTPTPTSRPLFPSHLSVWLIVVVTFVFFVLVVFFILLISCVCFKKGIFHIYREQHRAKTYARMAEEIRDISTVHPNTEMSYGTLTRPIKDKGQLY